MWWHTVTQGGEVKGKLANGVSSQYPSHYLGTWCIQHYYRWCAHLGCQWSTELTPPGRFKWTCPFRRNLVSARVPSHFKRSLHTVHHVLYRHFLTDSCALHSVYQLTYLSFATTVSQLKICDFLWETFKRFWSAVIFWVQQRHNCVMTLYLLKVHLRTFLSIPINQKCQILSCDILVANERY